MRFAPSIAALAAAPTLVIALALATTAGLAQRAHNSKAPIDFSADHIELQDKANRAVLSGSVEEVMRDLAANRADFAIQNQLVGASAVYSEKLEARLYLALPLTELKRWTANFISPVEEMLEMFMPPSRALIHRLDLGKLCLP